MQLRPRTTSQGNSARRGVTLIEMLITVMIIGIMASVAIPRFANFYQTERLNAAARRIVADLNLVKSYAATTSSTQTVTFSLVTDDYVVSGGLTDPQRPTEAYSTRLNAAPYSSSITSANFDSAEVVSFNGAGLPNSGGSIVISNGPRSITIVVDAVSGKATVN